MDTYTGAVNLQPNSMAQAVVWSLLKRCEWLRQIDFLLASGPRLIAPIALSLSRGS